MEPEQSLVLLNCTSEISKLDYRKQEVGINETKPNERMNGKKHFNTHLPVP